ncbi:hypothetical protein QBC47DRAFT_390831 [Echria macrotheca]|uniref:Transcription factor Iwr1 domain-containing protein n=1 Tax=Echria macrotheca TaxID=438768 RepID=A0AAJ0B4U5_9PEZI|nr:hypothetical protein QBC47DRAFT_390831 [Echria macrotheca]
MSGLPPDIIHVKRKRGVEDGPVEFLHVEKRVRSEPSKSFIYQRKTVKPKDEPEVLPTPPIIQASRPGDENRPIKALRRSAAPAPAKENDIALPPVNEATTRRFHFAKPDAPKLPTFTNSRKRRSTALFVERTAKKKRSETDLKAHLEEDVTKQVEALGLSEPTSSRDTTASTNAAAAQPSGQTGQTPKLKRPGVRSRTLNLPKDKPALPPSFLVRDNNIDLDKLALDMDKYTLSHMAEFGAKTVTNKPKVSVKRFAERHPDFVTKQEPTSSTIAKMVADIQLSDSDNDSVNSDDYVLETYERVPASRLRDQAVPASSVGVLVFDNEPEQQDFFYGEEEDDESDEDSEDSNAEDHYAADYPDEDLDWGDQFDQNPYNYERRYDDDEEDGDGELGVNDNLSDDYWEAVNRVGTSPWN